MRVAIISTHDMQGGAARAACRLHQSLRAAGVESTMLVGHKTSTDPHVAQISDKDLPGRFFWPLVQSQVINRQRTPRSNTLFSFASPGPDLAQHPLVRDADVINLHWVAGFQSPVEIARLQSLGKPVVWTLHDLRSFTGGCHYPAGCREFERACLACPQLQPALHELSEATLADAKALINGAALTLVTPSLWLKDEATRSALFKNTRVETIPYGLDTGLFSPKPKTESRRRLGLEKEPVYLLFGADDGREKRKGFNLLLEALRVCLQNPEFAEKARRGRIVILCFGGAASRLSALSIPVQSLGRVSDDRILADIYSAADVFVLPSLEDNLPCTMQESMSCGTPVAGFSAGGIAEAVEDGINGRVVPPGDATLLAGALLQLAADPALRESMGRAARLKAVTQYSLNLCAGRYLQLFDELRGREVKMASAANHAEIFGDHLSPLVPGLMARAVTAYAVTKRTSLRRWLLFFQVRRGLSRARKKGWSLPETIRHFDRS